MGTVFLVVLGAIVVPVLLIWSADSLFSLTVKTWLAAFFLLMVVRHVHRKKDKAGSHGPSKEE